MKTTYVFLSIVPVTRRGTVTVHGYVARWIARGTGSELYCSSRRRTEAGAERLARRWLERHPSYTER